MNENICDIVVELGRTKNQLDYFSQRKELKVGSVLKLDSPFSHIILFANGNLIAKGHSHVATEKFAFYITEIVNNDFDGNYGRDLIYDGIRVELARRKMPLQELKDCKVNQYISFDKEIKAVTIRNIYNSNTYPHIEEVYADIFVSDKLTAKGIAVGIEESWGVKITEIISS